MRYFLDTEFNGFGGALLSFALVPEDGGEDYYCILPLAEGPHPWVARHVLPYLRTVPPALLNELDRATAAHDVARYLAGDPDAEIVADWPEDIALFCRLLLIGEDRTGRSLRAAVSLRAPARLLHRAKQRGAA